MIEMSSSHVKIQQASLIIIKPLIVCYGVLRTQYAEIDQI